MYNKKRMLYVLSLMALMSILLLVVLNPTTVGTIIPSNSDLTEITTGGVQAYDSTIVHVVPTNVTASIGETFTINVVVENVTNLYGLDIQFSWDTAILEYVSHTAKIPVETFPDGILHQPGMTIMDTADPTAGTYWVAYACMDPAPVFDGTGVAFEMTFHVKASGACLLEITHHELADVGGQPIVHMVQNGYFTTGGAVAPIAYFDYYPSKPVVSETVTFDASASYDPDGHIIEYLWDFGDGTSVNETQPITYYSYSSAGSYNVELMVIDNDGQSGFAMTSIRIGGFMTSIHVVPQNVAANPDETFTIAVEIADVHDLYGLDIQFSWDPTILEYVSHMAKIPVETFPDGILHEPGLFILNDVDAVAGTYSVAYACMDPAPVFDGTGVAFEMTFHVIASGECLLEITNHALADVDAQPIVHTVQNGKFTNVIVGTPIIHPEEGQYANYLMTVYNESGQMPGWMKWNITYANYVTPYLINVTTSQQDISGHIYTSSILVNVLTREMSDPYSPPDYYYFGWIETNITISSTIRLLDTTGVVKGEEIVEAAGTHIDCWIVEMTVSSEPYVYNYTMWYDKATGLWIGMKMTSSITPDQYVVLLLIDTNVPLGSALRIETDKPMYTRLEVVTATATLIIGDIPVESATVTIQVDYPNGTVYFVWTTTTNTDGTATITFFIDENAPYGTYVVSATAYKPGIDPRTATTTFIVGHLEPHIEMWFEGPDVALIGFNTTIVLHVQNVGNATAYNVAATLSIPSSLVVISANTTFTGIMDPGHEVTLVALVIAATPSRHTFNASTSYTKVDGTPMDTVYEEKTLVYAYHEDYAVDFVEMTVTATNEQITVELAITNYGDSPVEITLIASAQHISSKLILPSTYQTITLNPGETATISLVIAMPSAAPSGDYIIQGILATGLPSQDGFTLTRGEETVTV